MNKLKTDTSYDEQVTQDNNDPIYVDWRTRNAVTPVKDQVGGHLQGGLETVWKSYVQSHFAAMCLCRVSVVLAMPSVLLQLSREPTLLLMDSFETLVNRTSLTAQVMVAGV